MLVLYVDKGMQTYTKTLDYTNEIGRITQPKLNIWREVKKESKFYPQ